MLSWNSETNEESSRLAKSRLKLLSIHIAGNNCIWFGHPNDWASWKNDWRLKIPLLGFTTQHCGSLSPVLQIEKKMSVALAHGSWRYYAAKNISAMTGWQEASSLPGTARRLQTERVGRKSNRNVTDYSICSEYFPELTKDVINHIPRLTPQPRSREPTPKDAQFRG